jgi:DNA primase
VIAPAFVQDLLSRVDIVEIVGRQVQLKKAGSSHKGLCPFHGEKTPSFTVSPTRQTYHCFGCGVHGNAIGFLMEQAGMGFVDAVRDLAQQVGVTVPQDDTTPEERARAAELKERRGSLGETLAKAAAHYRKQLKASPRAVDYLKRRGLTGEIAARFGLGYAPDGWRSLASAFARYDDPLLEEAGLVISSGEDEAERKRYDRFRDRVMFPIRSVQGEVIAFGGRVIDQGEPKYLNSPETPLFSKGRELYGLFEARQALRQKGFVLVVEGYMDVVALAQLGFANTVATLGTACTAEHVQKLFRFTDAVVFSFDGDAAGRRAASRALEAALPHASDTRNVRFLFLPPEHDPDSYVREQGSEAFEQCIAQAVPLSRQLLEVAREGCDLGSAEGRARMLANAKPLWQALPEGALRRQVMKDLATSAGLSADDLVVLWKVPSAAGATPRRSGGRSPLGAAGARRMPLRGATNLLDRALWILVHDPQSWDALDANEQLLLAEQAPPYGAAFATLERVLHDEGPQARSVLLDALRGLELPGAAVLAERVAALVAPLDDVDLRGQARIVLDRLRLKAIEDELEAMFDSGALSEDALRRSGMLAQQRATLKAQLGATVAPGLP